MLAFDWLEQTDKIGQYFRCENDLCRAMLPDCMAEEYVFDINIFVKWGILNVSFCSIFVPFFSCDDIGCTMFR